MVEFSTVWDNNSPYSLVDISIKCCIKHTPVLFEYANDVQLKLRHNFSLPREICDRILYIAYTEASNNPPGFEHLHHILKLFQDPIQTRISRINLSDTKVTDDDLEIITRHAVTELNVSHCPELTKLSFGYINRLKASLLSLNVSHSPNLFPCTGVMDSESLTDALQLNVAPLCDFILDTPHLRILKVEGLKLPQTNSYYFHYSLSRMSNLTHLDLSKCRDLNNLDCLKNHQHLQSLILYHVPGLERFLDVIQSITTLRHLDISQPSEGHVYYRNPNRILRSLVTCLPNLVSLDISGTNLAGDRVQEREEELLEQTKNPGYPRPKDTLQDDLVTDIAGLKSRVHKPLEFLGLYNTAHEACYRHHIPAKRIAGDANEEQILTAGQVYCSRPETIQKVLNDLFHIFRFSSCNNTHLALDVVMEAMRRHIKEKHIQISGSASLFYIVKGKEKNNFNIKIKKKIIKTLLDAMLEHNTDVTMIRNGCLTLIHFKIPEDVFFDYERLVNLLLLIIAHDDQDEFVQRIGVYLLNSIACQVDGIHKQLVGDRGAIFVMMQLISIKLSQKTCDEVMETAWSAMWNVTDETPINCRRFLEADGMALFLECLKTFPDKPELLRNMMGLLGNVAEVKELRSCLMTDTYITVFSKLAHSKCDGIEVSYNAVGILSHIISDGPEIWQQHNISLEFRQSVLVRMIQAIENWNLNAKRNINYRSFEPIIRLLYVDQAPEAQYWAIWALANLTCVYPDKYCSLVREEGGLGIIEEHSKNHKFPQIRELSSMILRHCDGFIAGKMKDPEEDDDTL